MVLVQHAAQKAGGMRQGEEGRGKPSLICMTDGFAPNFLRKIYTASGQNRNTTGKASWTHGYGAQKLTVQTDSTSLTHSPSRSGFLH